MREDEIHRQRLDLEILKNDFQIAGGDMRRRWQAADRLGVPVDLLWRRLGKSTATAGSEQAAARPRSDVVRSEEEKALHLLLVGETIPGPDELPLPAVFFDPEYRTIYETWLEMTAGGERPSPRELIETLGDHAATVARLVQDELQLPVVPSGGELASALAKLRRRWQRQRARELSAEIAVAERRGQTEKVDSLLQEKASLSRALHPRL